MKLKYWCAPFLLCLSMLLLGSRPGSSQEVVPLEPQWLRDMYADGWQKVEEGVLQREGGGGAFETFAYGAEGIQWMIQDYESQIQLLEDRYQTLPSEKLAELIERLKARVSRLSANLRDASAAEDFNGERLADCEPSFGGTATVSPRESPQGVTATATAYYHDTCGSIGDTAVDVYAEATEINGTNHDYAGYEDPRKGSWIDSYATTSAVGYAGCYSRAEAMVSLDGNVLFTTGRVENTSCPSDVIASIAGPAQVSTDAYGSSCVDVTWTASASEGNPGYTYSWYLDEVSQGTGLSLTKQYCGVDATVTVKVVATDSRGWTDDATLETSIRHTVPVVASVRGPATVVTDYYSSPCADVTWTASATGGHSGYTYSWYVDGSTTAQGTGSTFTKNYCSISKTASVRVVALDSDGHSDDATVTTAIQHIGPVAASVSGPSSVTTDYYSSTCADVTWTANTSGGHPGYTYSWYLGAGTTLQGSGSSFTKNYCSTNQNVTARVVARDSDGHTAEATRTTNIKHRGAITASIAGPASVSTNTTTPCADVTWTASASSNGHTGFTYKWYIGTTLQGSGATLTKRYCSTSQTVTVKAIADASEDTHVDDVTFTTTITHVTNPTVTITGPEEVFNTPGYCSSITLYANVTGGTPGYTYSWYLNNGTTVVSTGSSYTKNVCTVGFSAKVTVRDAAAKTASDTHSVAAESACFAACP